MSGLRILAVLGLITAGLIFAVFRSPSSVEDDRGWVETEAAFAALAQALAEFEPVYEEVIAHGLMLELKARTQDLRERLASLRERRLLLRDDSKLPLGKRLPAYRALATESDVALANLLALSHSVRARYEFFRLAEPLLETARRQRDALRQLPGLSEEARTRAGDLDIALGALESRARDAQGLLSKNPRQNKAFAASVLKDLQRLVETQRELLAP